MRTPRTNEPGLNAWVITSDFIADNEHITEGIGINVHAVGKHSHHCPIPDFVWDGLPNEAKVQDPARVAAWLATWARDSGLTQLFRLYDDDGVLYYEGYMRPLSEITSDDADGFEPLDDFGGPNAGATELRYWLNEADKDDSSTNPRTRGWHTL